MPILKDKLSLETRWQKIQQFFQENIESVLISSPANVRYLSGFPGSLAYILFTPEERYFFTDFRYAEEAKKFEEFFQVIIFRNSFIKDFSRFLKKKKIKMVAFEADNLSVGFFRKLKKEASCDFSPLDFSFLRAIKEEREIREIKKAVKIAIRAFQKLLLKIRPGLKERDIAVELEYLLRKEGSDELPFSPIVASGPNSSKPHAQAGLRKVKAGDIIKIDWGAKSNGYSSDLTRVVHLGLPDAEKIWAFRMVAEARKKALSFLFKSFNDFNLKKDVKASDIDKEVRIFFRSKGVLPFFGHGLGHGIGLEIHEAPVLNPKSRDLLKPGMIFTVEPGLYFKGKFGIRIEDDIFLRSDRVEVLSASLSCDWFVI